MLHRIGFDGIVTVGPEPTGDKQCTKKTAEACFTEIVITRTTANTRTLTTGTSTTSDCETVTGCTVSGADATRTRTTELACPTKGATVPKRRWDHVNERPFELSTLAVSGNETLDLQERADTKCGGDVIVFPKDRYNLGDIPTILANSPPKWELKSTSRGFTALWVVSNLDSDTKAKLVDSVSETSENHPPD